MLASPANQLNNAEATAVTPTRTANILSLEFSGTQYEPVLLSPGKWSIGASKSNQIVLDNDGVALRQFLIIVTEHRSVIKDWSADGLWNGKPFESAVLGNGDKVEIADVELTFRLAKSLDLISQLPYVADHDSAELVNSDAADVIEVGKESQQNTVYVTSDGRLSFEDSADRLDELITRIESSVTSDMHGHVDKDFSDCLPQGDLRTSETQCVSDEIPAAATRPDDATMGLQAARVDEELRQLEELRAAVQQEREQLLEKRALLVQESLQVESQLKAVRGSDEASPCLNETEQCCDDVVDESARVASDGDTGIGNAADSDDASFAFGKLSLDSLADQHETEAVAAEREKLRHLLEEFDSANEANCDEEANVEATVGVAQALTEYSVMNALRSRDDAVKQLDELVLAATGGLEPQIPAAAESLPGGVADGLSRENSRRSTTLPDGEYHSEQGDAADDHDHSALSHDPAPRDEARSNVEASFAELGALINKVDPAVTHSADDTFESSTEEVQGCETNEEVGTFAPDESALVERQNAESQFDDAAAACDLTALASGLDASSDEPQGSTADVEAVPTVEFENEDVSPEFNPQVTEVSGVDSGAFETDPAQQDSGEDSFTLQSSDSYEIVEEPQPEAVAAERFASQELTADPFEGEASADGANSESVDTDSNVEASGKELEAAELAKVNGDVPSWFDSKFMAEGDSVVEDEPLGQTNDAEPGAADDVSSPEGDEPAADIRQKLAEMFDLPALTENTESIVSDETLESRLQQFRDEPHAETTADDQADNSPSWPNPESTDSGSTSAATLSFDPVSDSATEEVAAFESETLDEFPTTTSAENVEPDSSTDSNIIEAFEPEETSEEENSISAYMERLLARNRQVTGASPTPDESTSTAATAEPKPSSNALSNNTDHETELSTPAEEQRENWLEKNPRHRQNRDQVRAEVQVLRQIANQSARSAVATASRRDIRKQVIVKTTASILALTSGVAALLLDVSMMFGLTVLTIGLLFSGDLALTIFRNWKYVRDIKRAAAGRESETSSEDDVSASDKVNSTTA